MKSFLKNLILFILVAALAIQIIPVLLLFRDTYQRIVAGNEIYLSIRKSKQKHKFHKLLLGDSVARQLFPNNSDNDTLNSLACNQSIGMVGQYILLNNYIQAKNDIDTVYMVFSPFSFINNLDQVYTYHYFIKPFYNSEYHDLFTTTVHNQIHKIPFTSISHVPLIFVSNWAPDFNSTDSNVFTLLSPISVEYLFKIKKLSEQYHFTLVFIPPPLSIQSKYTVAKMLQNEIIPTGLSSEFNNYFNRIEYFDDSCFSDGHHLKDPSKYIVSMKK